MVDRPLKIIYTLLYGEMIKILNINMESLKKVAIDFYNITKMKIVLYDEKRQFLYSYPENMCRFCEEVRKSEPLSKQCFECDKKGFDMCDKSKGKYIYTCHMGMTEAISPILENNIIIGYMMLGQVLETSNKTVLIEKLTNNIEQAGLNEDVLHVEIQNMQIVSRETLSSAADMMEMCACYLWIKQIINVHSYTLAQHLNNYIEENLTENLSVKTLCKYLHISKSTLYKLSLSSFGMGISDYIKQKRLETAKKLIADGSLTIAEVAVKSGISDTNYFTKLFKKHTLKTPKEYRKNLH